MASCCRLDLVYSFNPPDQLTDQAFAAASFRPSEPVPCLRSRWGFSSAGFLALLHGARNVPVTAAEKFFAQRTVLTNRESAPDHR